MSPLFSMVYDKMWSGALKDTPVNDKSASVGGETGNREGYIPYGCIPGTPDKYVGYTPHGGASILHIGGGSRWGNYVGYVPHGGISSSQDKSIVGYIPFGGNPS